MPCCTAILRRGGGERIAALFNLDSAAHEYAVPLPADAAGASGAEVLLDTDWQRYGGSTPDGETACSVGEGELVCNLAPLSGVLVLLR